MPGAQKIIDWLKSFFTLEELKGWITAFIIGIVFYFVILTGVLGTSSPGTIVSSCSEKGFLNVGDVIIVQGTRIEDVRAPLVTLQNYAGFTPVVENNRVDKISIGNQTVTANSSNDIVIYKAFPSGAEIIHRALVKINTSQGMLLLTKGDANSIPDQMTLKGGQCIDENIGCISTPITQKMLVGKSIFTLPLLGHVKLFLCDATLGVLCEGHANKGTGHKYTLWC